MKGCLPRAWAEKCKRLGVSVVVECLEEEASRRGFETISDMLYIMYVEERRNIKSIADMFCVKSMTITQYLSRMGVYEKGRPIIDRSLIEEAVRVSRKKCFSKWQDVADYFKEHGRGRVPWGWWRTSPTSRKNSTILAFTHVYGSQKKANMALGGRFVRGGKRKISHQERVQMYNEYLRDGKTQAQIARERGLSDYAVWFSINRIRQQRKLPRDKSI